jgi:DNA-binding winged helix-turn-helix (wHTH) protein
MLSTSQVLIFDNFRFNVATRELLRIGGEGPAIPISLGSRAADLLLLLLRRPGELVTKNEIIEAVWLNAAVDESNLPVQISTLRRALDAGRSGASSIQTIPGRGYRFTLRVTGEDEVGRNADPVRDPGNITTPLGGFAPRGGPQLSLTASGQAANGLPDTLPDVAQTHPKILAAPIHVFAPALGLNERVPVTSGATRVRVVAAAQTWSIAVMAAGIAALAVAAVFYLAAMRSGGPSMPAVTGKFDASVVPLVDDQARRALANYPERPDNKALAISNAGYGMAVGAADIESAKQEALQRCSIASSGKASCRLYAIGTDVIWANAFMPTPADIRQSSLGVPFLVDDAPLLNSGQRKAIEQDFSKATDHKALALGDDKRLSVSNRGSRDEAVRLAVERCSHLYQVPCLLVSVDGFWTVQTPKSHRVKQIFTLAGESEMSEQDKQRIGAIYQGPEWRALARGRNRSWYAVAGADSEAAAVEGAFKLCAEHEGDCRLYAIGNFLVDEFAASSVEAQHAAAPSVGSLLNGINLPGADYSNISLKSPEPRLCQDACRSDGKCAAWTYVEPGLPGNEARCWLKDRVPPQQSAGRCCTSGVERADTSTTRRD